MAIHYTLAYNTVTGGWFFDTYTPSIVAHYGEEGGGVHGLLCGGSDGHLYRYTGTSDNGTAIQCIIFTPAKDQDTARIFKLYEDCILDCNPNGVSITVTPSLNSLATDLTPTVILGGTTRTQSIIPVAQISKNIGLKISFPFNGQKPIFFIWEPRFAPETAMLSAKRWTTSPNHYGMGNYKHIGEARIVHVSTVDLSLQVTVDGVAQTPIIIPNSSGLYAESYFRLPVYKGKLYAFDISCPSEFRLAEADSWFAIGEWDRGESQYQRVPVWSKS